MDAKAAAAAVEHLYGELPKGHRALARPVEGTPLWSVGLVDDFGWNGVRRRGVYRRAGCAGLAYSSNPGLHDPELAIRAVALLYDKGVGDRVDEEYFGTWLRTESQRRHDALCQLVDDAVGGSAALRV